MARQEDLVRSVADIASPSPHTLTSIEGAMDQLTADLAALCLDQLERRLGDEDHDVRGTDEFEGELQVNVTVVHNKVSANL